MCRIAARGAKEGEEFGVILCCQAHASRLLQASCKKGLFFIANLGVSSQYLKSFLLSSEWGDWTQQEVCYKGKDVLMLLRDVKSPGCHFVEWLS